MQDLLGYLNTGENIRFAGISETWSETDSQFEFNLEFRLRCWMKLEFGLHIFERFSNWIQSWNILIGTLTAHNRNGIEEYICKYIQSYFNRKLVIWLLNQWKRHIALIMHHATRSNNDDDTMRMEFFIIFMHFSISS